MKILYSGLYGKIGIRLMEQKYFKDFEAVTWYDVPDNIAKILLKSDYFVCENDFDYVSKLNEKNRLRIALNRWGALGDLLFLLPVARRFKETYNASLVLVTQKHYISIFKAQDDVYDDVISEGAFRKAEFDNVIHLGHVLEKDHSLKNTEREIHRIKLYGDFLKVDVSNLNWDFKISNEDKKYIESIL